MIRKLPLLAAAYAAGRVLPAQLRTVAAVLPELPEELWGEVDGSLAVLALTMTAAELGEYLRKLADAIKPTPKPREETQQESRRLSLSVGFNGMTNVVGRLTHEVADKLRAALSSASRPDVDGEARKPDQRKATRWKPSSTTSREQARCRSKAGRNAARNGAWALIGAATISRGSVRRRPARPTAPDGHRRPRPTHRSRPERRRGAGPPRRHPRAAVAAAVAQATDPRPQFAWTGPTSPGTARRLSCDGIVLPIFTRGGQPLDVGRPTRVIPTALRAFIVARD